MAAGAARTRFDEPEYERLIGEALTDLARRAKVVIRPDLQVLWQSDRAEEILTEPAPVILQKGQLHFPSTNQVNGAHAFLESLDSTPRQHLLRAQAKGHWALLRAWVLPTRHRTIAMICSLSAPCLGVAESGLAEELNLTRSEASILDLFGRLHTPRDIADELGISIGTVRSHLKQIYSKAEV
ncbi:MAG: LuxR C-terminal-related transcriptional regulator, partial [Tsuneonella sp.]